MTDGQAQGNGSARFALPVLYGMKRASQ